MADTASVTDAQLALDTLELWASSAKSNEVQEYMRHGIRLMLETINALSSIVQGKAQLDYKNFISNITGNNKVFTCERQSSEFKYFKCINALQTWAITARKDITDSRDMNILAFGFERMLDVIQTMSKEPIGLHILAEIASFQQELPDLNFENPESRSQSCAICRNEMAGSSPTKEKDDICIPHGEIRVTTTCGHSYHFECLAQWEKTAKTCPMCRKQLGDLLL